MATPANWSIGAGSTGRAKGWRRACCRIRTARCRAGCGWTWRRGALRPRWVARVRPPDAAPGPPRSSVARGCSRRSSVASTGRCPEPGPGSSAGSSPQPARRAVPTGREPWPGRVALIVSTEFADKPTYLAWRARATGGVERRELPVGHVEMLRDPGVALLAESIEDAIAEALAASK